MRRRRVAGVLVEAGLAARGVSVATGRWERLLGVRETEGGLLWG